MKGEVVIKVVMESPFTRKKVTLSLHQLTVGSGEEVTIDLDAMNLAVVHKFGSGSDPNPDGFIHRGKFYLCGNPLDIEEGTR